MKILGRLLFVILIALLLGGALFYCIKQKFETPITIKTPIEITIPKGTGLNKTAQILATNKLIDDARWFILYARMKKISSQLKAGEYYFNNTTSIQNIAHRLVKGDTIVRSITIPEGKALVEIKKIIQENPFLKDDITIDIQEGEILPETYHFNRGTTRNEIILKAKKAMDEKLNEAYTKLSPNSPLKSKKDILTLASIVEKETGIPSERNIVASVFINRLNIGMRLQTDPTVIYAVTNGQMNLNRPIYKKDLAYDSPYNTYVYQGLPPTPICSPGKDAINAVITPAETNFLYFVADGITGGHRFASTLSEHNKNVASYRKLKK